MKALILAEFDRYKLAVGIVAAATVLVAAGIALMDVKGSAYSFSVLGFCYLLALLIAFVGGRMYDYESDDFRFLAVWPQSRASIFAGRFLSHLLLAGLTIALLYLVAIASMLISGRHFAGLWTEQVVSPTAIRSISLFLLVFAFSAFWSQFTGAALSLLMTLISVIAIRFWVAAGVDAVFRWRLNEAHLSKQEVFARLYDIPAWITAGLALCIIAAAAVGFVRAPLLEVKRRAFWSTGIVMVVLALLGLVFSLEATNWLGMSEARYDAVQIGMDMGSVANIMGRPQERYVGPGAGDHIGGVSAGTVSRLSREEAKRQAQEVWRWSHFLDQRIGIVFDRAGRVILKWVDY